MMAMFGLIMPMLLGVVDARPTTTVDEKSFSGRTIGWPMMPTSVVLEVFDCSTLQVLQRVQLLRPLASTELSAYLGASSVSLYRFTGGWTIDWAGWVTDAVWAGAWPVGLGECYTVPAATPMLVEATSVGFRIVEARTDWWRPDVAIIPYATGFIVAFAIDCTLFIARVLLRAPREQIETMLSED